MDWPGFFMDLQEAMQGEGRPGENDIVWHDIIEPGGGVQLIARWGSENIGNRDGVYLQIHKGWPEGRPAGADGDHFLAFRLYTRCEDREYQRRLRDRLTQMLIQVVTETPVAIDNGWANCVGIPMHLGIGFSVFTIKFGVTTGDQSCWLVRRPNGTPDINRTIQKLRQAHIILREVARRCAASRREANERGQAFP